MTAGFELRLPDGRAIELRPDAALHVVLGRCDVIADEHGHALARLAAVDWARPRSIPALDVPGALPPGAGSAVLNLLATRARDAGVASLRYRGPYPSEALFDTLRGSFAVAHGSSTADARERFTADVESAAFAGRSVEPAVDFVPDPHAWSWPDARVCAQHRHGLERVWIDGRAWDRDGVGPRRLRRDDHGWRAVFEIADEAVASIGTFDDEGRPLGRPLGAIPVPKELVGLELPPAACAVVAEAVTTGAIAPLRAAIAELLRDRPLVFGDSGFELARLEATRIVLHATIAAQLERIPPARSLAVLVAAVHPCVARAAQRALAHAHGGNPPGPGVDPGR